MNPLQHLNLLLRFDRTFNLRQVIGESISPGDRVLDAGCGLGILSQWAVGAGAAAVDAVDLSDLTLAKQLARENGVEDKINFQQRNLFDFIDDKNSANKYDCLIAMIYLNDPRRDEQQTRLTRQLKDHLLKPDGTIIPDKVEYSIALCDWPDYDWFSIQSRLRDSVNEIEGRYRLSFDALKSHLFRSPYKEFFPDRAADGRINLSGAKILNLEQVAFTIDYVNNQCEYPADVAVKTTGSGCANVALWWQRIFANGQLIFTNQSISWIQNPQNVSADSQVQLHLDDNWRNENSIRISNP